MPRKPQDQADGDLALQDPSQPTDSLPGSLTKVEILRRRNEAGLPLWHPQDRRDYTQPFRRPTDALTGAAAGFNQPSRRVSG